MAEEVELRHLDLAKIQASDSDSLLEKQSLQEFVYHAKFWRWMLDYTAGECLDELATRLSEIVDEFVIWHSLEVERRKARLHEFPAKQIEIDISPVDFDNQTWYQDALQLISVAILLRDAGSAKRIILAMDSLRSVDGLFEALIEGYAENPIVLDSTIHGSPYDELLGLFDADTSAQSTKTLAGYCDAWYMRQDGARWYDGHLKVLDERAPYYGYWAFEAGAAAFLLDIDDSAVNHMVYPKDLVAYARQLRSENRRTGGPP